MESPKLLPVPVAAPAPASSPFRFSRAHDLALLHQTLTFNPFPTPSATTRSASAIKKIWEAIADALRNSKDNLQMDGVTGRSCRRRVKLLWDKLLTNPVGEEEETQLTIDSIPRLILIRAKQPESLQTINNYITKQQTSTTSSNCNVNVNVKRKFYFSSNIEYDLALLAQVQALNPMAASTVSEAKVIWERIASNLRNGQLQMAVTGRSCRERTALLQKQVREEQQQQQVEVQHTGMHSSSQVQQLLIINNTIAEFVPPAESGADPLRLEQPEKQQEEKRCSADETNDDFEDSVPNQDQDHNIHQTLLNQLESRVTEIEKQLKFIYGLLGGERPSPYSKLTSSSLCNFHHSQPHQEIIRTTNNRPRPYKVQITHNDPAHLHPRLKKNPIVICDPVPLAVGSKLSTTALQEEVDVGDLNTPLIKFEDQEEEAEEENPGGASDDDDFHQSETTEQDPEFTCPHCPSKPHYSSSRELEKHLLIHQVLALDAESSIKKAAAPPPASNEPQPKKRQKPPLEPSHAHSYKCAHCSKAFRSHLRLQSHINNKHNDTSPANSFICPTCGKTFTRRDYLAQHEDIHLPHRKYACTYCDSRFRQKKALASHIRFHLVNLKGKAQCNLCGQLFVAESNVKTHIRLVHQKIRAYACQECGKRFKTGTSLKYHAKTHQNPNGRKRGLNRDQLVVEAENSTSTSTSAIGSAAEGLIRIKRVGGVTRLRQVTAEEIQQKASRRKSTDNV